MTFRCASCGAEHDLGEISFGADAPDPWGKLSAAECERSELGDEQCVIETGEGTHFFVRACLEIPIAGGGQPFSWGVWCSLSENSFWEMSDHWEDPARTSLGPYFGWLCTRIPGYPDTLFLKTRVHQRAVGLRPLVELEPTEHPLSVHQRNGIGREVMQDLVSQLLHDG